MPNFNLYQVPPASIPNNITNLTRYFYGSKNLVMAPIIPDSVTDMSFAFEDCYNLREANIPNNVVNLSGTFSNCRRLTSSPIIPNSVTDMSKTFKYCTNLTAAPNIPNSVTNLFHTFEMCSNLKTPPIIPNSVTNMRGTFRGCNNLTEVPAIPNNIKDISFTFELCSNLKTAPIIPNSVTNMRATFVYCEKLTRAPKIPDNVNNICGTFAYCDNLKEAPTIPNNVTDISYTFGWCTNLTTAPIIPNNITNICCTFIGCTNLSGDVYIYSDNIKDCEDCFYEHNPENELNLYIHKDTLTWNTFKEYLDVNINLNIHMKELKEEILNIKGEMNMRNIKELRKQNNITQKQLATALGIPVKALGKIEKGETGIDKHMKAINMYIDNYAKINDIIEDIPDITKEELIEILDEEYTCDNHNNDIIEEGEMKEEYTTTEELLSVASFKEPFYDDKICITIAEFSNDLLDRYIYERLVYFKDKDYNKFKVVLDIDKDSVYDSVLQVYIFGKREVKWKLIYELEGSYLNTVLLHYVDFNNKKFKECLEMDVKNILNVALKLMW